MATSWLFLFSYFAGIRPLLLTTDIFAISRFYILIGPLDLTAYSCSATMGHINEYRSQPDLCPSTQGWISIYMDTDLMNNIDVYESEHYF